VEHLLSLGHRRIACLAGPASFAVSGKRIAGWRKALAKAGIAPRDEWLLEGEFRASSGHELARTLIKRGEVTAIFASNDLLGIGALRAAAEQRVAVPQTLSVIGFDGIEMGAFTYPALTTVGYPIREIGETAAAVLMDRIAGRKRRSREIVVEPRIILRESTGRVRRA
jgi:LacI family transcriptional regulator